ncbi:hypothetical protein H5410_020984 [Solanum commersonii]|uniref:Uncharacterized protein n=1 Tax=Solanum commersonii TaxID=4109 RepID=A0A9J5ZCP6_SOLCO|nr:hypothetical protein H5410_020984 [Solanum commersonii]
MATLQHHFTRMQKSITKSEAVELSARIEDMMDRKVQSPTIALDDSTGVLEIDIASLPTDIEAILCRTRSSPVLPHRDRPMIQRLDALSSGTG